MADTSRITIDGETAGAVEDALSYYLASSSENFGSGWGDEDAEDVRQLIHERGLVAAFMERVEQARHRMEGST